MQYINSPVSTLCIGQASSMGSFLLAAEKKEKIFTSKFKNYGSSTICWFSRSSYRYSNSRKEILSLKDRLNTIYSKHTGKSVEDISKALERIIL